MQLSHHRAQHIFFISCFIILNFFCTSSTAQKEEPIHLDDIHFIVTNEEEAVSFFQKYFGAKEMAHPGDRFDLARFLSIKWQDPTITITPIGPYKDLPPDRNKRWMDATIILPSSEKHKPVYGAKWLAISTPSITKSYDELKESGAVIYNEKVILPLEPNIPAFSIYGPDGVEIVLVERSDFNFDDSKYAIDHIQFLVKNIEKTRVFFKDIYSAKTIDNDKGSVKIQVADANLVLSNPEVFNLKTKEVSLRKKEGTIRIGLDHLGFLYKDISKAASNAKEKGYSPLFKPQRYIYKNKPTVYTFTAFTAPDNLNIEMVQVDGRIGPHSYYEKTNE